MAGNIDERIVQMEFDNAQFERGVSTSINTIDKLKKALRFDDVSDGFNQITKSANKVDLSGIQNSLEKLQGMFTPMGLAFVKVWTDAVGKVEQKVASFNKAVFKDPFDDGFKEYELKMGSVQTIMNSSGESLDTVNEKLQELNEYADRTIYSFSDMTSNIGKFTNAGVSLNDAVKAIQGVSNVAALSGANANEASRAMYNFAQALSSGAVKLIDWKSIENANMATQEFKKELIDSALELGTLVRVGDRFQSTTASMQGKVSEVFDATMGFNDSLSSLWMTTDVLTKTLGKFSDETTYVGKRAFAAAQDVKTWTQLLDTLKEAMGSGWAQSFEIIIGDFNEAKELFTMISNALGGVIDKSSKVRNSLLQLWRNNGGREKLLATITKMSDGLEKLYDNVLSGIFGNRNYQTLLEGINPILEDTTKLVDKLTQSELDAAWDIWTKGLYGTGEERKRQLEEMGYSYERVQGVVNQIANGTWETKELTEATTEEVQQLEQYYEKNIHSVYGFIQRLKEIPELIFNTAKSAGTIISNIAEQLWSGFTAATNFFKLGDIIKRPFQGIADVFSDISANTEKASIFEEIGKRVGRVLNFIVDSLNEIFTIFDRTKSIIEGVLGSTGSTVLSNITIALSKLTQGLTYAVKAFVIFSSEFVKAFVKNINFKRISSTIATVADRFRTLGFRFYDGTRNSKTLSKVLNTVMKVLDKILEISGKVLTFAVDKIIELIELVARLKDRFIEWAENIDENSRLYRAWTAIKTIATNVWDYIKKVGESIKESFGRFSQEQLENSNSLFGKMYDIFTKIGGNLLDSIVEGLEHLASMDLSNLDFSSVKDFFETGVDKVKDFFNVIKDNSGVMSDANIDASGIERLKTGLAGIFDSSEANGALAAASKWATDLITGIIEALGSESLRKALTTVGLIAFVWDLFRFSSMLTAASNALNAAKTTFTTIQTQITKIGTAFTNSLKAMYLDRLTLFILALAGALTVLSLVDTNRLTIAGIILYGIMRTLEGMVEALSNSKLADSNVSESILKDFTNMFIGIGIMIAAMVYTIKTFKSENIKFDDLFPVLALVTFVSVIATGLIFVAGKLSNVEPKVFKNIGIMIAAFAGAVWILMKSVAPLKDLKVSELLKMFVPLLGVIIMLSTVIWSATQVAEDVKAGAFIGLGVAVSMILGALNAVIPLLIVFSKMKPETWEHSILGVLGVFAGIAILIAVLNRTVRGTSGRAFLSFTGLLVVSLGALAGAFYLLDRFDIPSKITNFVSGIKTAFLDLKNTLTSEDLTMISATFLGTLLSVVGLIAVLVRATSGFGRNADKVGRALLHLSLSFLAMAGAVWLIVNAFEHLPAAADAIVAFNEKLKEHGPEIKKTIAYMALIVIGGLAAAFVATKYKLVAGIISAVLTFAQVIYYYGPTIIKVVEDVCWEVVYFLEKIMGTIVGAVVYLIAVFINKVALAITEDDRVAIAIESLTMAIGSIVNKLLVDAIGKPIEEITSKVAGMLSTMGTALKTNKLTKGLGDVLLDIGMSASNSALVNFREINKLGRDEIADQIRKNEQSMSTYVRDTKTNTLGNIGNLWGELGDKVKQTTSDIFGVDEGNAFDNIIQNVTKVTDVSSYVNVPEAQETMASFGEMLPEEMATGLEEQTGVPVESFEDMLGTMEEVHDSVDWEGMGGETDEEISDGMSMEDWRLENAAGELTDAISNKLQVDLIDTGWDVGHDYVTEIARGMDDAKAEVGWGEKLSDAVSESAKDSLDGLTVAADSVEKATSSAKKTVTQLYKTTDPEFNKAVNNANYLKSIINNERQMDDSITTVRLSESASVIARLKKAQEEERAEFERKTDILSPLDKTSAMIAKYPQEYADKWAAFGAAFSAEAAENTAKGFSSGYIPSSTYFSAINTKIDDLDNKVSNMQIVMDTGALVGATSPAMNEALGTASSYSNYTSRSTITRR